MLGGDVTHPLGRVRLDESQDVLLTLGDDQARADRQDAEDLDDEDNDEPLDVPDNDGGEEEPDDDEEEDAEAAAQPRWRMTAAEHHRARRARAAIHVARAVGQEVRTTPPTHLPPILPTLPTDYLSPSLP